MANDATTSIFKFNAIPPIQYFKEQFYVYLLGHRFSVRVLRMAPSVCLRKCVRFNGTSSKTKSTNAFKMRRKEKTEGAEYQSVFWELLQQTA